MIKIAGIDPGSERSAIAVVAGGSFSYSVTMQNNDLLKFVKQTDGATWLWSIEDVHFQNKRIGRDVLDTAKMIGKLQYVLPDIRRHEIRRCDIVRLVTNGRGGGDSGVRHAIIEMCGGKTAAIGTKWNKGPLFEVSDHEWSALAAALALRMKLLKGGHREAG